MSPEEREQLLMKIDKSERKVTGALQKLVEATEKIDGFEEKIVELQETVDNLTKYISIRGGVVQINAPLSIKGGIEFMQVRILQGAGVPSATTGTVTGDAPNGSMYLRHDAEVANQSLYMKENGTWYGTT